MVNVATKESLVASTTHFKMFVKKDAEQLDKYAHFLALRTAEDVAELLDVRYDRFVYHIYKVPDGVRYTSFGIPKRNGGTRVINAPATALKLIQEKLNEVLAAAYDPPPAVHGFTNGRSVVTNAQVHCDRGGYILNVDLEEFFPSINFGRVWGMLQAWPYNLPKEVATVLAQTVCHRNQLPQGAPTSPVVANMVCRKMDAQLTRLSRRYRCRYTRYADDLTFSTIQAPFPEALAATSHKEGRAQIQLGPELQTVIERNGFRANPRKIRLQHSRDHQEVTGITVNRRPNVDRRYVRQIRAMLHAWRKFGLEGADLEFAEKYDKKYRGPHKDKPLFPQVLKGKINYLSMVRGREDPIYQKLLLQYNALDPSRQKKAEHLTPEDIFECLWVIESETDMMQGTAFSLEGVGVVTCEHVLFAEAYAYKPKDPDTRYPISIIQAEKDLDLAIIDIQGAKGPCLRIGDSAKLDVLSPVFVAGFPYHRKFDPGTLTKGEVAGFKPWASVDRILVTCAIVGGMSGGPLLNNRNQVIGVAATGQDSLNDKIEIDKRGCIPIHTLKLLGAKLPF